MQNNTTAAAAWKSKQNGDYFDRVCLLGVKRNSAMLLLQFSVLPSLAILMFQNMEIGDG